MAKVPLEQQKFIKAVAGRVREHGKGFEEVLKEREKENPKFVFLFKEEVSGSRCDVTDNARYPTSTCTGWLATRGIEYRRLRRMILTTR